VPYWLGGALVALVVMSYVFFGGMRGTAWVNSFQTVVFLSFGAVALVVISRGLGGFGPAMESLLASPDTASLLTRERVSPLVFLSYTFIPLSTIAFPHITIFCLTARRLVQFKRTVILYPLCILAIWLPCVFLGVAANAMRDVPKIEEKLSARRALATAPASTLTETERNTLRRTAAGDVVILVMLERYAPLWLAGLLGAGIMAAVMASDSQILALSTMFTEDVFAFYGGRERFGEAVQVQTGRLFVVILTVTAYVIALRVPQTIFDLAVQFAFSGYASLSPLLFAALFWPRSTKWGALAVTLWTAFAVLYTARVPGALAWAGLLPVVPMTLISCALMLVVSLATPPPSAETVARYRV
jgi:SSS family solute:Na+ symporter